VDGPWVRDRGGLRAPAPGVRGSRRTPGDGQRLRGQHRLMPADGARRDAAPGGTRIVPSWSLAACSIRRTARTHVRLSLGSYWL
jgi:hypothetical protein